LADSITDVQAAVARAHETEWSRVLAAVARTTGDLDLAEDCVEDAYIAALTKWSTDGIPNNPGAWLTTTARRRAIDQIRRGASFRARAHLLAEPPAEDPPDMDDEYDIPDERLRLVFTCCHPALSRDSQIALTLRLICGLPTEDIASLFLVPLPTMAARLTRAKKKIAVAKIPYRVPEAAELPERLSSVLAVIYLLFTTGHTSPRGQELTEPELIRRSFELVRMLLTLMPDEQEVRGLLALMLLIDARRDTRVDESGDLILLEDQDRTRWDKVRIAEGTRLVEDAFRSNRPGIYAIQAAIAATHANAPSWAETDWPQLLHLYDGLMDSWPSPVVDLNRAAVILMIDGPERAMLEIERLETDERLSEYVYLPSLKADLYRRLERNDEAAAAYDRALLLATNESERRFLQRRRAELHSA
jgi:RNA polymerase sigma-70 factor (ECF subfamily)